MTHNYKRATKKYISPDKLQRGDVIGRGILGLVHRGKLLNSAGIWQEVAIKQSVSDSASPPSWSGSTPDEQLVKEVSITIDISGRADHVVQCMGWSVVGEGQFALVMKLYNKSLYTLIEEQAGNELPLVLVVKIGLHIARGMLELHTEHIVFEGLKPHNVLLDVEENAFLADFGLSKRVKDLSGMYTSNVGRSYLFMAPEKLRPRSGDRLRTGFASDVWAFGITMLQLLCCDTMAPYGRSIDLPDIIMMLMVDRQSPQVPAVPDAPELQSILQACLSLDYKERPFAAQLVQAFEGIFSHLQSTTLSTVADARAAARANEMLKAQLAAAEAQAAAAQQELTQSKRQHRQELSQTKRQHRQEMARVNDLLEQRTAEAAAKEQQVQQLQLLQASNKSAVGPAVVSLRLLSCRTCTGHSSDVRSVAFTPDGTTLVSGSNDKTIKLWDVASGSCRDTLKGHTDSVRSVAVSRDGCTLASGSFDKTVRLWNLISRRCIATLSGRTPWTECVAITASVNSAAISPDGANWVESVTESVDISPNGATLASGSLDRNVWCTATLSGHTDLVYSVAICPYGTIVASGSYDKTVRLWYVLSGKHKATLQGHSAGVYCVAFSPDGTHLASGGGIGDCTVRLWDMSSASCVAILKGHTRGVSSVVFSHDGAALLSGSYDTTVQVWDARTGANKNILQGHTSFVDSVALTPDGAFAASGSGDKTIKVWDWKRWDSKCVATLQGHGAAVYSVAVSPDGKRLASGSFDKTIKLWRIAV